MMPRLILLSLLLTFPGCARTDVVRHAVAQLPVISYLGEGRLANDLIVEGTPVGGISGLDLLPDGAYVMLSDDRSSRAPARYYVGRIAFGDSTHSLRVSIDSVITLKHRDGSVFAPGDVDPESIRYDSARGMLIWSSEGDPRRGVDPAIRMMRTDGTEVGEIALPPMFHFDGASGPRENAVFEGMTLIDTDRLVVSLEEPLLQDGPTATVGGAGPIRISTFNLQTGRMERQVAYIPERAPSPVPDTAETGNGISEILALEGTRILVLERGYASGAGVTARIFVADLASGEDVSRRGPLAGITDLRPVRKRLLLDLATLGLPILDNVEGMCWGPDSMGTRTLLLVSDNNFNPRQVTQIIAVGMDEIY